MEETPVLRDVAVEARQPERRRRYVQERGEPNEPAENAQRLRALLGGDGSRAEQDIVALNTGALLMTAGKAATLREGAAQALDLLRSGAAGRVLDAYVEASRG